MNNQAERIIAKFGNARQLAAALAEVGAGRDPTAVYKWTYPREKGGTGGYIPAAAVDDVKRAAERRGVQLTGKDWGMG